METFEYIVRESTRAKQVQLRITERCGLEVVIPKRLINKTDIVSLLNKKRDWIQKNLQTVEAKTEASFLETKLPDQINLKSAEEIWYINYVPNTRWEILENSQRELTLLGNIQDSARCKKQLISWLKGKAENYLGRLLIELSLESNLFFRTLQIRGQQTRWGSCSSQGDISLNYQLLFLPVNLVRHTLLHELAHTAHMNHGVKFWRLLMKLDPQTKIHAYESRRARIYVPKWIY